MEFSLYEFGKFISELKDATTAEFTAAISPEWVDRVINAAGTYTVKVVAEDNSGNVAEKEKIYKIDLVKPVIGDITGVTEGSNNAGTVAINVPVSEKHFDEKGNVTIINVLRELDGQAVTNVVTADAATSADSIRHMSFTEDGTYSITAESTDAAGNRAESKSISIPKKQVYDGLYELTVTAQDYAGRVSTQTVNFTVNRFGSVFVLDQGVIDFLNNPYTQKLSGPIKITEYNASEVSESDVNVMISKDGSLLRNPSFTFKSVKGDSSWYCYEYTIDESNFVDDGIYRITLSSKDTFGNLSETIKDDRLGIVFCVDTTRPELVSVAGLDKKNYNAAGIDVDYEIFDAIGIKSVEIYVNGVMSENVTNAETLTQYNSSFRINEGAGQHIRFVITDMAGNVTDTDNKDDSGYVADFNNTVTVSTNFFVRWYANKRVFVGSIAGADAVIAGGITFIMLRRKKFK